jgi:hypothetical protein
MRKMMTLAVALSILLLTGLTMTPTSRVLSAQDKPAQTAVNRLGRVYDTWLAALDSIKATDIAAARKSASQALNAMVGSASELYDQQAGDPIGNGDQSGIVGYIDQLKSTDPAPSANWTAAVEYTQFLLNQAVEHNQAVIQALMADPVDSDLVNKEIRITLAFLNAAKGRRNETTATPDGSLPEGYLHDTRIIEGGALLLLDCSNGAMTSCP